MQKHEKGKSFSKQTTQCSAPEPVSELQRNINSILGLGEDKENVHEMLDNFYLSYLKDSLDYQIDRGNLAEHFYLYAYLQKLIRLAEESSNLKNVQP